VRIPAQPREKNRGCNDNDANSPDDRRNAISAFHGRSIGKGEHAKENKAGLIWQLVNREDVPAASSRRIKSTKKFSSLHNICFFTER